MTASISSSVLEPPHVHGEGLERDVVTVSTAPTGYEGEGFPVKRAFAGIPHEHLDPFIHMDEMGAVDYAPYEPRGTAWHPHRGFETVTYMLDGAMQHQDSHGGGGLIGPGDTQWMTAGSGILHIETPPEELVVSGGRFHGLQLWVNLASGRKLIEPAYQDLSGNDNVVLTSRDGGSIVRLIAGQLDEHTGPGRTNTPATFVHATINPGSQLRMPWPNAFNALAYTMSGNGHVGGRRTPVEAGQLAVFDNSGDIVTFTNPHKTPWEVIVLGGRPLREPVVAHGPFVMNTRNEIVAAFDDYQSGKFGEVAPDALQPYRRRRN